MTGDGSERGGEWREVMIWAGEIERGRNTSFEGEGETRETTGGGRNEGTSKIKKKRKRKMAK